MKSAKQFIKELREGSINEAIKVLKVGLEESLEETLTEKRINLFSEYGFIVEQSKDEDDKEDETEEDKVVESEDEDNDDDKKKDIVDESDEESEEDKEKTKE